MKKAVIGIILYILLLHIFIPSIYYYFYGFVPIYSDLVDYPSLYKAAILITIPLILGIFILKLLPSRDNFVKPVIDGNPINILFYFSILFKLATFYLTGGFEGILSNESSGSLTNYISLFLNPFTLLLLLLFFQKTKSNVLKAISFYVVYITLSGSRSGIISIFFIFFIGFAFQNFKLYASKIKSVLKIGILLTPILFIYASSIRGIDEIVGVDFIINQIVGRASTLETSMMPLYFQSHNLDLSLFSSKYSFWNQFKLSLDALIPGQIFEYDVMPNNYYRSIFMGFSESFVFENYMSINLTLPIYLFLKYGYFGIVFTVFYIVGFYKILLYFKNKPYVVILLLSTFYNLIYFFDWVMIFITIYSSFLTILTVKLFIPFYKLYKKIIGEFLEYKRIQSLN